METTASFGYWVRRQRKALDLTQQVLAERIGCSLAAIKKIESDERRPSRQVAERLADILSVPAEQRDRFLESARGLRTAEHLPVSGEPVGGSLPTGTVTFLYTDIEGSTPLWTQHAEAMAISSGRHDEIVREAIESNHGYIFQVAGDGFCAAFHTAGDALRAAVRSQINLQGESWRAAPIHVRMGLHTGKAEVKPDGTYVGYLTMSHAQRVMSGGHGGQILLSFATQQLVQEDLPEGISLRELGVYRLKGFDRAEQVFQVIAPTLPSEFPPLESLNRFANNLPAQLTSFIGRERELEDLKRLLAATRLLTLTGPGGTGKTRLALQLATNMLEAFPQGVWLVELAPLADPALVMQTVASSLGLREEPGRTIQEALTDYVRAKTVLIVLDNCEHLLDACARLADTLLHAAPGLKILASSREALGITGETSYRVPSLPLPEPRQVTDFHLLSQNDCVRLFVERSLSADPAFRLHEKDVPIIANICRRLDGIPLAIELAAARTKFFSPQQIAARLDERFKLLTGGSRTALERHQTLFALIEWSHNLLSESERILLRQLSVFAGGWSLEAGQAVCGDDIREGVFDTLAHLVDKSLVAREEAGEAAEGRYRLLETVRQYARDRLLESGGSEGVRDRHLDYFLGLAKVAESKLRSREQLEWLKRLETEHDNLRAALGWALESDKSEKALDLAGALHYFWGLGAHVSEGQMWLSEALTLSERHQAGRALSDAEAARRAKALYGSAWFHIVFFDIKSAREAAEESLRLWRGVGDKWWTALALEALGMIIGTQGELDPSIAALEEGVSLGRHLADPLPLAVCLVRLGDNVKVKGMDMAAARRFLEEGVAVAREVGDRSVLSEGLRELGTIYYAGGDLMAAERSIRESLANAHMLGSIVQITLALCELTSVACLQGDRAKARSYCMDLWTVARDTGALIASGFLLVAVGLTECFGGDLGRGARLLSAIDSLTRQRGVDLFSGGSSPLIQVIKQVLEKARSQLGAAAFDAAWAGGRGMTLEQALALAEETAK